MIIITGLHLLLAAGVVVMSHVTGVVMSHVTGVVMSHVTGVVMSHVTGVVKGGVLITMNDASLPTAEETAENQLDRPSHLLLRFAFFVMVLIALNGKSFSELL